MDVLIEDAGKVSILKIIGNIDLYTVVDLKHVFQELNQKQKFKLIVDLEKVEYMDSSALGLFVKQVIILDKNYEVLRIIKANDSVKLLFQWTNIKKNIRFYDSLQSALDDF
ncbi:MAG: STAS domain-containing protein [Leptospiraceae bacterium]|nr:STAS domain-containing protein [Leptospiraceae bacterium]